MEQYPKNTYKNIPKQTKFLPQTSLRASPFALATNDSNSLETKLNKLEKIPAEDSPSSLGGI